MRTFHGALLSCLLACAMALGDGRTAKASDDVQTAGDFLQITLVAASAGSAWSHRDLQGFEQFGKSAAFTLGVTHGLKFAIDARRPNGGTRSFPSGHTSISFCSAEFLRRRYGWTWGVPAYAAACFVGYSRVESRQHYTRDVLAGALIGVASSCVFAHPLANVSFDVSVSREGCALAVARSW